jgi:aldehyde dehydrogenase (NAD+)
MTRPNGLFIGGAWHAGATEIENRNPSDLSDLIGQYAQADAA